MAKMERITVTPTPDLAERLARAKAGAEVAAGGVRVPLAGLVNSLLLRGLEAVEKKGDRHGRG